MVGFKVIDDFTFDDCVDFINQYDEKHPWWKEIFHRHSGLLKKYRQKDNTCFKACKTYADYENYIARFSNLKGASMYRPIYLEQAKEQMSKLPDLRQSWIKRKCGFIFKDASLRHPITNFFLYGLLIYSFIVFISLIIGGGVGLVWGINITGIGGNDIMAFIMALLISLNTIIGVLSLIRWNKIGITILIIGYSLIISPPIVCKLGSFEELTAGSALAFVGCIILWLLMLIKKNGVSSWERCAGITIFLRIVRLCFIGLWIFNIIALPYIAALKVGFKNNLYSNGKLVISAYYDNSDDYYPYLLYKEILLGSDFSDDANKKREMANYWYSKAKNLNNESRYSSKILYTKTFIFLDNIIFLYKNMGHEEAIKYINSQKDNLDTNSVFLYKNKDREEIFEYIESQKDNLDINSVFLFINDVEYCLYRIDEIYLKPNSETIIALLNECNIYEPVYENRTDEE